jgi:hypothetical protein
MKVSLIVFLSTISAHHILNDDKTGAVGCTGWIRVDTTNVVIGGDRMGKMHNVLDPQTIIVVDWMTPFWQFGCGTRRSGMYVNDGYRSEFGWTVPKLCPISIVLAPISKFDTDLTQCFESR